MNQGNLSDVFGAPAAGGLAGRLPRIAPAPAQATPVAVPVAVPLADPVATQREDTETSPDTGDDTTRQITIYVLPHVPDRIRADKRGRTNAAVVYDAIEAAQQQIPALLAARRAAPQPSDGGLFARQTTDQRGEAGRVTWTFKTTPANRRVLDQLVDAHGAVSRSELVSTVLEHTYPPVTG